jgi:hypothetical protein
MADKIKAVYIYEILGKPPEHIKETLGQYIDKLGEITGVKVLGKKIHEPHAIEDKNANDLYTTFGEAELEIDDINTAFAIVFHMLPANIEILEPSEIRLRNFDMGSLLTELAVRIHKYDEIAKALSLENNILKNKLGEIEQKIMQAQQAHQQHQQKQNPNIMPVTITTGIKPIERDKDKKKDKKEKKNNKDNKKSEKKDKKK